MTISTNGASTIGRSFFRYLRPSVNGFGTPDEPDPDIATAVEALVALLEKGFVDHENRSGAVLTELRKKLKELEDERMNGTQKAHEEYSTAIGEASASSKRVLELESEAQRVAREIAVARDLLEILLRKQERVTVPDEKPKGIEKKRVSTDSKLPVESGPGNKPGDLEVQIKAAREVLQQKKKQQEATERSLLEARKELTDMRTLEQQKNVALEQISEKVKADTQETLRAIEDAEEEQSRYNDYSQILKLERLPEQKGPRVKCKIKIGSDADLNSLFLLVEDKLGKSSFSFNAALFLRHDVVVEYLFLRAYLVDGLRDAEAIFDRVTNEAEGGVKYIYDYIVERAITKIIKAKKLHND